MMAHQDFTELTLTDRLEAEATLSVYTSMKRREALGELGGIDEPPHIKRNRREWSLRLEYHMLTHGFIGDGAIVAAHHFNLSRGR